MYFLCDIFNSLNELQVVVKIPDEWVGKEVHFRWNSNSEALLFNRHGEPLQVIIFFSGIIHTYFIYIMKLSFRD